MKQIVKILTAICFLVLLGVNFYRFQAPVKSIVGEIESKLCTETELEQMNHQQDKESSLLDGQELLACTGNELQVSSKREFFMDRSASLPWQHADDLLMPPERFCAWQ